MLNVDLALLLGGAAVLGWIGHGVRTQMRASLLQRLAMGWGPQVGELSSREPDELKKLRKDALAALASSTVLQTTVASLGLAVAEEIARQTEADVQWCRRWMARGESVESAIRSVRSAWLSDEELRKRLTSFEG